MQLSNFMKNVRRQARLETRVARLEGLTDRATEAKNDPQLAVYAKEGARRLAEINYLKLRNEADLEDHPEWQDASDAMREAVLAGSRGSRDAKAIMAAALTPDAIAKQPAEAAAE